MFSVLIVVVFVGCRDIFDAMFPVISAADDVIIQQGARSSVFCQLTVTVTETETEKS